MKPKLLSYLAPALLAGTFLIAADQPQLKLPQGYVIPPSSVSPNREYGVSAFDNTVNPIPDEIDENKIVDLHTSQIVGIIHGSSAMIHMNRRNSSGSLVSGWITTAMGGGGEMVSIDFDAAKNRRRQS